MDAYRSLNTSSYQRANSTNNTNADPNRFDDLLIFGYACKLFRDDEKALHIDQGKHLMPWMGDSTLKIDRFDVRAELNDVSKYEPPPGGYDNRMAYLSAAEQRAEQLCEEERYYSLFNNDFEEDLYKEEEQKRGQSAYGQIGFSYDQPTTSNNQNNEQEDTDDEKKNEEPDEPFIPNPRFYIPSGVKVPETTKVFAIIEKTTKFIASQGAQMEILIKAKQTNNPLFDFLNQNGPLNPFYKHMLQVMKDDNYPSEGGQYIPPRSVQHENIAPTYVPQPSAPVPVVKYKPSADCAYTQLISRIKGVPIEEEINSRSATASPITTDANSNDSQTKNGVEIKKISNGLLLAQYYGNSDTEDEDEENDAANNSNGHETPSNPLHSLDAPIPSEILCPPPDIQVIIDKTASYVLKNGTDFEEVLRTRNDERFTFLRPVDQFHRYYKFRVTGKVIPKHVPTAPSPTPTALETKPSNAIQLTNGGESSKRKTSTEKPAGPVSFSIKTKEEPPPPLVAKPALPVEASSDEEESAQKKKSLTALQSYVAGTDLPLPVNFQQANFQLQATGTPSLMTASANGEHSLNSSTVDQSDSFIRDTILEQQNLKEKKQAKRAEDKVRDRLAQLAREKLGILSKEKQLQLERKKKAMAFLTQIGGPNSTETLEETSETENQPQATQPCDTQPTGIVANYKSEENQSDSSDSVTFVSATPANSSEPPPRQRNLRKQRPDEKDDDNDRHSEEDGSVKARSRSRTRRSSTSSRSRSRTVSKHSHKKKRSKKKSSRRRSRSRSRSRSSRRRYSRSRSRGRKSKKRSRSPSRSRRHKKRRYSSSD